MRTHPKPALAMLGAVLVLSLGLTSTAQAAFVTSDPSLAYVAGPGEVNDVSVSYSESSYTITDAGVATITDGDGAGGCTVAGNEATCPLGQSPYIDLGDEDDAGSGFAPLDTTLVFNGGPGDDDLSGSLGNEAFLGGSGADTITGGDGFDQMLYLDHAGGVTVDLGASGATDGNAEDGPPGARDEVGDDIELLQGSDASDTLIGAAFTNVINGGDGDDTITGSVSPGAIDNFFGGTGDDTITGGPGDNALHGGEDDDTLIGGPDANQLFGDNGNDTLTGSDDAAVLPFGDYLSGGNGDDTLNGGGGGDSLNGGSGDDDLDGQGGDDNLDGGLDADSLSGGGGSDAVSYLVRTSGILADIGVGGTNDGNADDGPPGARDEIMADVESLQGGSGGDTLTGSSAGNTIGGGGGVDMIDGLGGDDTLLGGDGDDTVNGGGGQDTVFGDGIGGEVGDDTLDGGGDADSVFGNEGADTIQARDGIADYIDCGTDADSLLADLIDTIEPNCESVDLPPIVPPGGGGGAGQDAGAAGTQPTPPIPDQTPPAIVLSSAKSQRLVGGSLSVTVSCPAEACAVSASGTLSVPNAAKVYKLKPASKQLGAGSKVTLKLRLDKKAAKAVKRALKQRRKVKAKVSITAKDAAGNSSARTTSVTLKK